MSTPIASISQDKDDDGPEEGEIEDDEDEDDIILLGTSPQPQRSSSTSASVDIFPRPTSKESYERDIRRHELHRARAARIRRASGGSNSPYGMGSSIRGNDFYSRTKPRHYKSGITQGKENRHVRRHKSPLSIHHHHRESHDKALADFKETSPLRRDSSCSSIDSEDRSSHHKTMHRRSTRFNRTKRKSSSSPDSVYTPSKRRSYHSEKCPLIKVLHSVAKETRLIAIETSENNSESSSLRQKLLNMGVVPALPQEEKFSSKDEKKEIATETGCKIDTVSDTLGTSTPSLSITMNSGMKNEACNEGTQTEELIVVKREPEVVILTDSEDGGSNRFPELETNADQSNLVNNAAYTYEGPESSNLNAPAAAVTAQDDDDDDDDISRLRLLALQSKKHEHASPDDADVLQLRLAALKTAFVKKFKTRKRMKNKAKSVNEEDPLSLLDEIPLPSSPHSPDEVMTPIDMELAETDDESVHSVSNCYSPSDPTVSPLHDPSLQELLPPPPPPDLPIDIGIDLHYSDQNYESSFHCIGMEHSVPGVNMFHLPPADPLLPPPLPPYFRELLAGISNDAFFIPPPDVVHSNLPIDGDAHTSNNCPVLQESTEQSDTQIFDSSCENDFKYSEGESFGSTSIPATERPNLLEVPVISELSQKYDALFTPPHEDIFHNSEINVPSKTSNQKTESISVGDVFTTVPERKSECDVDEKSSTKLIIDEVSKEFSLEEEEQLLRQRLLRHMANKRGNLSVPSTQPSAAITQEVSLKKPRKNNTSFKSVSNKPAEVSSVKVKPTSVSPLPPLSQSNGRVVIDLGEDSDSSEDYSESEALGRKCAKNRAIWLRQMKDLEVNSSKLLSPGNKAKGNAPAKLSPQIANLKVKQSSKESNMKKPFAENLADLESSVERFLKGVRSSHESISKLKPGTPSVSVSRTPVAVRHLPASQQEEYRRLKQQIAKLEKQRQISSALQKQAPRNVMKATRISSAIDNQNPKQVVKTCNPIPLLTAKQLNGPTTVPCKTGDSRMENAVHDTSNAEKKEYCTTGPVPSAVSLQPLRVAVPQAQLNHAISETKREVSVSKGNKALANVSNLNIPSSNLDSDVKNKGQTVQLPKTQDSIVLCNPQGLAILQSNLITERSHVLTELSALAKLLSQVDKSLEAQSHTATEVESLLDKLCLAAGRWKAQNRTVASLVSRVAQRQKDLSLRHRRCVAISKSCAQLGSQLHGKSYRVPSSSADAMRLQLKEVHEKTQDLAKRRTTEQARRGILEKRAKHCLIKLFSDTGATSISKANSSNSKGQALATSSVGSAQKDSKISAPSEEPSVPEISPIKPGKFSVQEKLKLDFSSEVSSSSLPKTSATFVESAPKNSTAVISRVVRRRTALNKLRSAKAILNLSEKKHIFVKQNDIKVKKFCSNRRLEDRCSKPDLSDMDISTDGEEAERRNIGGNTDVVDMSVSPDASSSPLYVETVTSDSILRNRGIESIENQRNLKTAESSEPSFTKSSDRESRTQDNLRKNGKSSSEINIGNRVQIITKNVLKDYVSPLGGLNVFSNNTRITAKEGDLYAILCPYDLNGKCEDSECPFKHQQQEV